MNPATGPVTQRGQTLLVVLVLLALFTLFAVGAFNTSNTNMRVIGNMQARQEAGSAAQLAIERTISDLNFAINPSTVEATTVTVDIDGNGSTDYEVRRTPAPRCFRVRVIKNADLDGAVATDIPCLQTAVSQATGIDSGAAVATAGDSMCANAEFDIRALATDVGRTGVSVAVRQGVALRLLSTDAENACP